MWYFCPTLNSGPLVKNHQSRMMKTRLVSFDGLLFMIGLFMIGQIGPCEVLSEKCYCVILQSTHKSPRGSVWVSCGSPKSFVLCFTSVTSRGITFWMASSLVCSCSACVKHIPTDPSFSVHVKENRCFTMCKSMRLFQSRAASSEKRPFSNLYPHAAKHKSTSPGSNRVMIMWKL